MSKFSERLKEYMEEQDLTETALANALGIRHTVISNFLLEKHTPRYGCFVKLLYHFHCSADYLLGRTDIPTEEPLHPVLPFSERLRTIFRQHSVTQEELKRRLSLSGSVLYKWLSGKSLPSTENLLRLADFFDCSVDYLIGRTR